MKKYYKCKWRCNKTGRIYNTIFSSAERLDNFLYTFSGTITLYGKSIMVMK